MVCKSTADPRSPCSIERTRTLQHYSERRAACPPLSARHRHPIPPPTPHALRMQGVAPCTSFLPHSPAAARGEGKGGMDASIEQLLVVLLGPISEVA